MNTSEHTNVHEAVGRNLLPKPNFFQPKLSVNTPGDSYEQEADAMADKVMRMAIPSTQNSFFKPANPFIQRKCAGCEEEDKKLHRKENSVSEVQGSNELDSYVSSLNSSGQSLSESSRQFFEPRFGQDFSNVKIHTDSVAAKSAQSINALAYTTGNNIVFNQGQYSPNTESGQRLMAHELTHVVQQGSSGLLQKATIQRDPPKGNPPAPTNFTFSAACNDTDKLNMKAYDATARARIDNALANLNTDKGRNLLHKWFFSNDNPDMANNNMFNALTAVKNGFAGTYSYDCIRGGTCGTKETFGTGEQGHVIQGEGNIIHICVDSNTMDRPNDIIHEFLHKFAGLSDAGGYCHTTFNCDTNMQGCSHDRRLALQSADHYSCFIYELTR